MTLRRMAPMKSTGGTGFPADVKAHVREHQRECMGALVGMPGPCMGQVENDHVRASGGISMKSDSIATNCARMCSWHHSIKTREGRRYRPLLIAKIAQLHAECADCQRESIAVYGHPLGEVA